MGLPRTLLSPVGRGWDSSSASRLHWDVSLHVPAQWEYLSIFDSWPWSVLGFVLCPSILLKLRKLPLMFTRISKCSREKTALVFCLSLCLHLHFNFSLIFLCHLTRSFLSFYLGFLVSADGLLQIIANWKQNQSQFVFILLLLTQSQFLPASTK